MGTFGDLVPFLEIGTQLRQRGHRVIVASAESFQAVVEKRGLEFVPTVRRELHQAVLAKPELWMPQQSFETLVNGFVVPPIRPLVEWVRGQSEPGDLTLVTDYCGGPAARLAQEVSGAQLVSIWANPAALRSQLSPPVIAGAEFIRNMDRRSQKAMAKMIHERGDRLLLTPINTARAELGLEPVASVLDWVVSPQASLALFPEWFAPRAPDWPAQLEFAGFVLAPGQAALSPEVEEFLQSGDPPVVVTFGTGMQHAQGEFEAARAACRNLGLRVLLVSPDLGSLDLELDESSCLAGFVPFDKLLPRARVLIHHAGLGTCAQALASGVPQLLIPLSHDQPDNAARLIRLGVAGELPHRRLTVEGLTAQLAPLLEAGVLANCRRWAAAVEQDGNGAEQACDYLERTARNA